MHIKITGKMNKKKYIYLKGIATLFAASIIAISIYHSTISYQSLYPANYFNVLSVSLLLLSSYFFIGLKHFLKAANKDVTPIKNYLMALTYILFFLLFAPAMLNMYLDIKIISMVEILKIGIELLKIIGNEVVLAIYFFVLFLK